MDGNSPDGSADMVAEEFPEVILIRNRSNESYARSVNQGIRRSRGRYACLLDSDTLLIENAFEPLVRFMDEHPETAVCGPKLLNPDGSVQHHIRSFASLGVFFLQTLNWHKLFPNSPLMNRYYNTDFDYSKAQQVESIGTTAYVIRRSTWETVGSAGRALSLGDARPGLQLHAAQEGLQAVLHAVHGRWFISAVRRPARTCCGRCANSARA